MPAKYSLSRYYSREIDTPKKEKLALPEGIANSLK